MKILKSPYILAFGFCLLIGLDTDAQPSKKISPALSAFLNTEFMVKFHDLGIEAEASAKNIQENRSEFSQRDYNKLQTYYDQTAQRANKILVGIKTDFLDKKKLKMITEYPEMYSDGLKSKMSDLSDFYSKNFQQTLADAQVFEEDGSAILLLITEVIGLTKGLSDYMKDVRREARRYNNEYLSKNLVEPYRWRFWEEVGGGTSRYNTMNNQPEFQRKDRSQELDNLNSRLHRVDNRVREARGKRPNGDYESPSNNTDTQSSDDWSDDSWSDDTWSDDTSNDSTDDWSDDTTDDWGSDTDDTDDWNTDDWGTETDSTSTDDDNWDDWGDDGSSNDSGDGKKKTITKEDGTGDDANPFIFEEWNAEDPKEEDKSKEKKKTVKKSDGGN